MKTQAASLLILALSLLTPWRAAAKQFDYIYVNANEGTASGGHVAVRFGDEVFHFQHVPPGWLRLTREDFRHFRFEYGYRENRTIRLHHIEVPDDSYLRLKEGFSHYWLSQNEQFERMRQLDADIRLLELLLRTPGSHGAERLSMPGLGLFLADGWQPHSHGLSAIRPPATQNQTVLELRHSMDQRYGASFLADRWLATRQALAALQPAPSFVSDLADETAFAPVEYAFSRHYTDLLTQLAALEVLASALPVQPGATRRGSGRQFLLDTVEVETLRQFRDTQHDRLVALLRSSRSDWGYPLLVGMARLTALDASIASRRLIVIDRFPGDERVAEDDEPAALDLAPQLANARIAFESAKAELSRSSVLDERKYAQLESAANRLDGLWADWYAGRSARSTELAAVPDRSAKVLPLRPDAPAKTLAPQLEQLRARQKSWNQRMQALYGYDLLANNCVTKIFQLINQSVTEDPGHVKQASERRLGGYIAETSSRLIPFLSFEAVGASYRVIATESLESYRSQRLQNEQQSESPLWVSLRESNTLTSAIYEPNDRDAPFLFFTDRNVLARPLLGGFNLMAGAAGGLLGLTSWPWDSGSTLGKALKGIAVSLPELVFVNIRKGSFPHLPEPLPEIGR